TRTVEKPMFNGNRLDWCATWGEDCGAPAADAFCKSQGFAGASDFAKEPHIGGATPTRLIATGAVCDAEQCDGFLSITCLKQTPVIPADEPPKPVDAALPADAAPPPPAAPEAPALPAPGPVEAAA